jgi:hypothetical protein
VGHNARWLEMVVAMTRVRTPSRVWSEGGASGREVPLAFGARRGGDSGENTLVVGARGVGDSGERGGHG